MANNYTFDDTIPLAPLKIAALESCHDLAQEVHKYILKFRKNDTKALKKKNSRFITRSFLLYS